MMKKKDLPITVFYISTAMALSVLGDSALYTFLPNYYTQLNLIPLQVGLILSINRWIRLMTNHMARYCLQKYPSNLWLTFAFLMASVVTAIYGLSKLFLVLLMARIIWGLSFSFIRQSVIMISVRSGEERHLGGRMGFYRSISSVWLTMGIFVAGLIHNSFDYTTTFLFLSALALFSVPFSILSQRAFKRMEGSLPVQNVKKQSFQENREMNLCGFGIGVVGHGVIMSTLGFMVNEIQAGEPLQLMGFTLGVAAITGMIVSMRWFIDCIGSPILGVLSDRLGRQRFIPGLFLGGALALYIGGFLKNIYLFALLVLFYFLCENTLHFLLSGQAGQSGSKSLASFVTSSDLGASFGPLFGWLILQFGFSSGYIFFVSGTIYLLGFHLCSHYQGVSDYKRALFHTMKKIKGRFGN